MARQVYTAPPGTGESVLGKTLPDLLYEAAARTTNARHLNKPRGADWEPLSIEDFRDQAEELALGLLSAGLERGDRVAFYMESDVFFCVADMGCLLAGLVDVPIYLTHAEEQLRYVLRHSEARALAVSSPEHLADIASVLRDAPAVRIVLLAERPEASSMPPIPTNLQVYTFEELRERGRARRSEDDDPIAGLRRLIQPHDLATIIYTSGTTGEPKGVMLSHENISHNALTSFSGLPDFDGSNERGISFLPLTHIFARTLHYGFVHRGASVYFTTPDNLSRDLGRVRPTVFATVPRVLEKVYARIAERVTTLGGVKRKLLRWALGLARRYDMLVPPSGLYKLQLGLADRLVFSKWRDALGGEVKYIISGGAALSGELTNLFAAAGVTILQGYGLTETSPVISFNRPGRNRPGTVGEPIPGVEVALADDGEILTRGPHIMRGYFKNEERTAQAIDEDGWFHTGDIGEISEDGFVRITDRKKDLFKLSTGKYVMPQPLENRLSADPLVEQAVVVGAGYKFTTALLFPAEEALRSLAGTLGLDGDGSMESLVRERAIIDHFAALVEEANAGMDHWATIKRFALVPAHLTIENGLLTPTLKIKRSQVRERFKSEIRDMYERAEEESAHRDLVKS